MTELENNAFLEVIEIKEIGEGMRVCVDFVDILEKSDGMFVGNTGHGYVKVLSENRHSEGYPPRPFRINCGSFHQYLFQHGKTLYLHEINPGAQLTINGEEAEKSIPVGRVKIEKRPFMRVECRGEEGIISATLQKSSSVYLVEEQKGEVSILDLKAGDRIMCIQDKPGRHLGEEIDEIIVEK
ncbi:3-dehydroquinate synthase II [Bacillus sp. OK048]|uniref:3-dehydroquinate synthase II n=1 Tax=Bacillus sp. OK048 TaxID=1882761 RepID=UPI000889E4CF|nr:3-dehydroquinate synthase II [Bacillus sp. OK048]SDM87694.1 3-dehydroquinate synthase II [Bacillus sp. OK048]